MAETTGKTRGASSNAAAAYESGSDGDAGHTHDLNMNKFNLCYLCLI